MLYLLFRITVFLIAAASLGFGVGWYVRQVSSAKREADIQKQLNTARSRVPKLEASLKNHEVDYERLKQELTDGEKKFAKVGLLIERRDNELVERERKITQLNNSLEALKTTPDLSEELVQPSTMIDDFLDQEAEPGEQNELLAQAETRSGNQDQLIREAEAFAEAKAVNHSQQVETLEEMLAEAQVQVTNFNSSQREAEENIRQLTDDISELRSAEGQHESEITDLEEELALGKQENLNLEKEVQQGRQENLKLVQEMEQGRQQQMSVDENLQQSMQSKSALEQELAQSRQEKQAVEKELGQNRQARVVLEQDLKQSMQVQFFMEQDLGKTRETGQQLTEFEDALDKLKSELDSQTEVSCQEQTDLNERNTALEEQLTRSRKAQLKLAAGYNEGMEALKKLKTLRNQDADLSELESERVVQQKSLDILRQQLDDARESEVRLVQRHRELEQTIEDLKSGLLDAGKEPAVLYEQLPSRVDDLKELKGLGVAAEKQLNSLGIYHFQQIAEFDLDNVDWVEKQLKKLKGKFKRDDWIAQATHLLNTSDRIPNSEPAYH